MNYKVTFFGVNLLTGERTSFPIASRVFTDEHWVNKKWEKWVADCLCADSFSRIMSEANMEALMYILDHDSNYDSPIFALPPRAVHEEYTPVSDWVSANCATAESKRAGVYFTVREFVDIKKFKDDRAIYDLHVNANYVFGGEPEELTPAWDLKVQKASRVNISSILSDIYDHIGYEINETYKVLKNGEPIQYPLTSFILPF